MMANQIAAETSYFVVPAPGYHGDRARVFSAHAALADARKAVGKDPGFVIRRGCLPAGAAWLRDTEESDLYPVVR